MSCKSCLLIAALLMARPAAAAQSAPAPAAVQPLPNHGLYALGFDEAGELAKLPYLRGGRILMQWADLEKAEGVYDFSPLDRELRKFSEMGRKATVQVNGSRKPVWLYEKVAVLPGTFKQVDDPQGALQYWDPIFVKAYVKFIEAYGAHLKKSPYKKVVLGIRQNFNAVGTEHGVFKDEALDLKNWTPAPSGHVHNERWKPKILEDYKRTVIEAYIRTFSPEFLVLIRNNIFNDEDVLTPQILGLLEEGRVGLFHTSSEHQPRGDEAKYQAFLRYCRTGKAPGYTEPYAQIDDGADGGERKQRYPSKITPSQYNYWQILLNLHCGISYMALKPDALLKYENPEFDDAFRFAAKYVGYHASPAVSPGAWVAMREGDTLKGDYTFLMQRLGEQSTDRALVDQGPGEQRFGGWARGIETGGRMVFRLDPRFAKSLRKAAIRIVFLDQGAGTFQVSWDQNGKKREKTIEKQGSGRWQEALLEIEAPQFTSALKTGDILLSGNSPSVFHMVEVMRID